ncbi:MAG: purine nucleoside phosphorylase inosine and guanosine-specific [Acidobacteriales bacterium]|nr:purine nucleoside phosphorylase inosine and guanosine-specific [Terriglobales bacterium]
MDQYTSATIAAEFVLSKTKLRPKVAIVLGSGLGAFGDSPSITDATRISFGDIPNFPKSTAEGHAGKLVIGNVGGVPIAAMQGRVHFYEGYTMEQVVFPLRVLARMGVRAVILTNAAGGISPKLESGCLVVLTDHINMLGHNPMSGPNDPRFGLRFFDMTAAYDPAYRALAMKEGKRIGVKIHEGVYLAVSGPSYETPAEIRAFQVMGADVVGMSTVPETIAARHMGVKVLAISCVTNLAAGLGAPLDHKEVLEVGERVRGHFVALLESLIPQLAADVGAPVKG